MRPTDDDNLVVDDFFALMGEDVDFIGDIAFPDIPVLTYRWSQNRFVSHLSPDELLHRGWKAMQDVGLVHIRRRALHLRGDTSTGQRVKMTVLNSAGKSMYWLMTAGMPGTRHQAKAVNRRIAERIEMPERFPPPASAVVDSTSESWDQAPWSLLGQAPEEV